MAARSELLLRTYKKIVRTRKKKKKEREQGGDCSSGQHGSSEMKYLDRLTEELAGSVLAVI